MKDLRVNERIRAREVKVVDENGKLLGIFDIRDALRMARERGLDLVEVAPNQNPPVCKIMDYGKYKYMKEKKEKERRKHQQEMKEIRMSLGISEHDYEIKLRQIKEFLEDGDKVRINLRFKGRQILFKDKGIDLLKRIISDLEDTAKVITEPKIEGRVGVLVLAPKR